jgi:hypothetical protein
MTEYYMPPPGPHRRWDGSWYEEEKDLEVEHSDDQKEKE